MGRQSALGMNEMNLDLETKLHWHLQFNHFPPISTAFIPNCIKAIDCGNIEDWDKKIKLVNGKVRTVGEIVEQLHLDSFIESVEDYDEIVNLEEVEEQLEFNFA